MVDVCSACCNWGAQDLAHATFSLLTVLLHTITSHLHAASCLMHSASERGCLVQDDIQQIPGVPPPLVMWDWRSITAGDALSPEDTALHVPHDRFGASLIPASQQPFSTSALFEDLSGPSSPLSAHGATQLAAEAAARIEVHLDLHDGTHDSGLQAIHLQSLA